MVPLNIDEYGLCLPLPGDAVFSMSTRNHAPMEPASSSESPPLSYRFLIEQTTEPVLVLDVQTECFVDFNQPALDLFRATPEELLQKTPLDLTPSIVHKHKNIEEVRAYLKRALDGENPVFDWIHADMRGRPFPCEVRLVRFPPFDRQLLRASIIDLSRPGASVRHHHQGQERLKLVMQATGLGCYDWFPLTNETYWDAKLQELFAFYPGSKVHPVEHFWDILHPLDRGRVTRTMEEVMNPASTQNAFECTFRITAHAERRIIASHGYVFRSSDGSVYRIIGACQDVTELHQREVLLQQTSERLATAQQLARIGSFEVDFIENNTWWSQGLYELLHTTPEETTASSSALLSPIHALDRQHVTSAIDRCKSNGQEQSFSYRMEIAGQVHHAVANISPIFDPCKRVVGIAGVIQDTTDQVKADHQLIRQARQLDLVSDAIITMDTNHVLQSWNKGAQQLYGWEKQAVIGKVFSEVIPTIFLHHEQEAILHALKQQGRWQGEVKQRTKAGETVYVSSSVATMHDTEGRLMGFIGVNRDITEEKEAERHRLRTRQLELQNRELEQFAYAASHDLQEPLRTLIGFTHLLTAHHSQDLTPEAKEYLHFISDSAKRMSALIRALLDYSRIGRWQSFTTVNCEALVHHLLQELEASIHQTHAKVEVGPLPKVVGYELELQKLFQHLLANGLKFHRENVPPRLRISARLIPGFWEFQVEDNGIGIEAAYFEKIFSMFQRLHNRERYHGTGIGLALCHKIVDLHGGRIWVASEPGQGSTFYFTLPTESMPTSEFPDAKASDHG